MTTSGLAAGGGPTAQARRLDPAPTPAPTDAGALRALASLLRSSHQLRPDDLVDAVADAAADGLVATELVVLVVDYEQFVLVPLPRRRAASQGAPGRGSRDQGAPDRDPPGRDAPLPIDGTLAGRAFLCEEPQPIVVPGGTRVWVPLLDGAQRLGVLGLTLPRVDPQALGYCSVYAALVAQLLVTKGSYTDGFDLLRRRRPMTLAAEILWRLLPPLTFSDQRMAVAGLLEPAYEVAGDVFDYALAGDSAWFAVFDSMGHGLGSSAVTSVVLGSYRHSRHLHRSPAETYEAIDEALVSQYQGEAFATGHLAQLDCGAGRLHRVDAGHPLPLLVRGGRVVGQVECAPSRPFRWGGEVVETGTVDLEPGDRLLFFTDGVVEARSVSGELFGEERLADLLARATLSRQGPAETLRWLSHAVLAHQATAPYDDATLLFVEWRGGEKHPTPSSD